MDFFKNINQKYQNLGSSCLYRNVFLGLILFELLLAAVFIAAYLHDPESTWYSVFNLDGERNVPAIFSALQLLVLGLVVAFSARLISNKISEKTDEKTGDFRRVHQFLMLLGLGIIFLSVDEAVRVHENISINFRHIEWIPKFNGKYGLWIIPYLIVGAAFFIWYFSAIKTIWAANRRATEIFMFGLVLFISGVVLPEIYSYYLRDGSTPNLYHAEVVVEELMEMIGVSAMLYAALVTRARSRQPELGYAGNSAVLT